MTTKEFEQEKKIVENIKLIKEKIKNASKKANRNFEEIKLMAVTKTVSPKYVNIAIENGINLLGENKAQELKEKYESYLKKDVEIHFIGHLQTNKVKDVVKLVECIESVDSLKLLETISKFCAKENKIMDVLLEINIGEEETKFGFKTSEILEKINFISKIPNIKVRGLMSIPPKKNAVDYFKQMRAIYIDISNKKIDNIHMDFLSMGTSDDFEEAIEYGTNIVRIGRFLFGER